MMAALDKVRPQWLPTVLQAWLLVLFLMHFLAVKMTALPRWSYGLVELLGGQVVILLVGHWREWRPRVPRAWLYLPIPGVVLVSGYLGGQALRLLRAGNGHRWVGSASLGVPGLCAVSLLHKNLMDSAVIWGCSGMYRLGSCYWRMPRIMMRWTVLHESR